MVGSWSRLGFGVHALLLWANAALLSVRATHVLGHLILGPDLLSRGSPLLIQWRLYLSVVAQIWSHFHRAEVDLPPGQILTALCSFP